MKNIEEIFEYSVSEQGWNDDSKVEVLLGFIQREHKMNILLGERFQDYLDERMNEENESGD